MTGITVAVLLVLGYALDSADGQLARLRGGGSLQGEWLDHTVDSLKVVVVHLAVLVTWSLHLDLPVGWLVVPLAFAAASSVHFFGMVLVDLLGRVTRAETAVARAGEGGAGRVAVAAEAADRLRGPLPRHGAARARTRSSSASTPCSPSPRVGYTLLVVVKWRRDVVALDALRPRAAARARATGPAQGATVA